MVSHVKEFHKEQIINLGTIQEIMDDSLCTKNEFQEIKKFYRHVDDANIQVIKEANDEMVDQIFTYYEACKFDKLKVESEEPI